MKTNRGHKNCSVKGCKNTSANSNSHFFRFPKDNERAKQWLIACNRSDLLLKTAQYLYAVNRICSNHFEERMYANDLKNRLLPSAQPTLNLNENQQNNWNNAIEANFHDYIRTTVASEFLPKTDAPASLNTNVQVNVSSTAENVTSLHDSGVKHNKVTPDAVILKPIHSVSTSLQPSILVFSANHTITNPKIIVTAPSKNIRSFPREKILKEYTRKKKITQHNKVQLSGKQSFHKMVQTTKDLCIHSPKELKLQKEIRILKKENAALREKIENMDLNKDQFLKCCEKYLSPQGILLLKEQISHNPNKIWRHK